MVQIGFRVDGVTKLQRNIKALESYIKEDARKGLIGAVNKLRDDALVVLDSQIGTGKWGNVWHGTNPSKSIRNKDNWVITYPDNLWNSLDLEMRSPHAAIVEFGGTRRVYASEKGVHSWPIGKSQGWGSNNIIHSQYFTLQRGYHYLEGSIHNPSTMDAMLKEISNVLKTSLRRARA